MDPSLTLCFQFRHFLFFIFFVRESIPLEFLFLSNPFFVPLFTRFEMLIFKKTT
jgi:hypothetical protein